MQQISEQEFNRYQIMRRPGLVEMMGSEKPTVEKLRFKYNTMLGIVLFDKIDDDWSFVALRRHDDGGYRPFDLGTSLLDPGTAIKELATVLHGGVNPIREQELNDLVDTCMRAMERKSR